VIDVSRTGAAIEPLDVGHDEIFEGMLQLELTSTADDQDDIRLSGEIRHRNRSSMGRVRVGVEFVGLTLQEEDLLELLFRLHAAS
jgi:PilZ domain